jgi:hypothetical protein
VSNLNDVKAKDAERAKIAAQLAEWQANGGIPQLVTGCRSDRTAPTQAEANLAAWENRNA